MKGNAMKVLIQRIYDKERREGYRVLVDRLWPRGMSRDRAGLDDWRRDLAPSDALRKWFDHDPEKWVEFRRKYLHELSGNRDEARDLLRTTAESGKPLILLYGARDEQHNQAVVLKDYLDSLS